MSEGIASGGINTAISSVGVPTIDSPLLSRTRCIDDSERVIIDSSFGAIERCMQRGSAIPSFECAGPRKKIFFDPSKTKCGIVTCGGLCPGINEIGRAHV